MTRSNNSSNRPRFQSEEEERRYWATHDLVDEFDREAAKSLDLRALLEKARDAARRTGLTKAELDEAVKQSRRSRGGDPPMRRGGTSP